jgi:hypothetical protein
MSNITDTKIDQIVDELVVDDAVAAQLKNKLHGQIEHMSDWGAQTQNPDIGDTADDLWDNLPI